MFDSPGRAASGGTSCPPVNGDGGNLIPTSGGAGPGGLSDERETASAMPLDAGDHNRVKTNSADRSRQRGRPGGAAGRGGPGMRNRAAAGNGQAAFTHE